jgi:hypothetical protein
VFFLRKYYPDAVYTAGLGELQDTQEKRLDAWSKGYLKGLPDLIIFNRHRRWTGFAIELKHPGFEPEARPAQFTALSSLEELGWKILLSNDYDEICKNISEYFQCLVITCSCCGQTYSSNQAAEAHRHRKRLREVHSINGKDLSSQP